MKTDLFYYDPDVVFLVSGLHSNGSSTFFLRFDHTGFADSYDLLVTGVSAALSFRLWPRFSVAFLS